MVTLTPSPGPVGTIVYWPKHAFCGVGGIGYQKRRSIVVSVSGESATIEPWSPPSRGYRRYIRKIKARRTK